MALRSGHGRGRRRTPALPPGGGCFCHGYPLDACPTDGGPVLVETAQQARAVALTRAATAFQRGLVEGRESWRHERHDKGSQRRNREREAMENAIGSAIPFRILPVGDNRRQVGVFGRFEVAWACLSLSLASAAHAWVRVCSGEEKFLGTLNPPLRRTAVARVLTARCSRDARRAALARAAVDDDFRYALDVVASLRADATPLVEAAR